MARWDSQQTQDVVERLGGRSLMLVGLMGCGKSTVGRRLATALALPFADADTEIELAARQTIPEIFADHGEACFRDGERRVIRRLLNGPQKVLATGGGAFMDLKTRATAEDHAITVWLKVDLEILMRRVSRRDNRPLLKTSNPRATMQRLMDERHPVYGVADITIESRDVMHEAVVQLILDAVQQHCPRPARGEIEAAYEAQRAR